MRVREFDSLPSLSARFIFYQKAQVSKRQCSSKAKGSNIRDCIPIIGTVQLYPNGRHAVSHVSHVSAVTVSMVGVCPYWYRYKYLTGFYHLLLRIYKVLFASGGARLTRSGLGP